MSDNDKLKKFLKENRPKFDTHPNPKNGELIWKRIEEQKLIKDRSLYWLSATACSVIIAAAAFWNIQRSQLMTQPPIIESTQIEMNINFYDDEKISEVDALLALGS